MEVKVSADIRFTYPGQARLSRGGYPYQLGQLKFDPPSQFKKQTLSKYSLLLFAINIITLNISLCVLGCISYSFNLKVGLKSKSGTFYFLDGFKINQILKISQTSI